MTKIYLHGNLKEKFGKEFDLDVSSSSEALKALAATKPGFLSEVINNRYGIVLGDKDNGIPVSTMEDFRIITHRDIHIIPVMEGADPGTIAAITLALDSFFSVILPANMAIAATNAVMYLAPQIGTSLLIAGVSALLSPQEHIFLCHKLEIRDPFEHSHTRQHLPSDSPNHKLKRRYVSV